MVLPIRSIQINATLFPNPVSMITPAIKKAITTNHVVESPKPIKAFFKVIRSIKIVISSPISTLVAIGKVLINMDRMVEMKMMNIRYAFALRPIGGPNVQSTDPTSNGEIVFKLFSFILLIIEDTHITKKTSWE